MLSAAVIIFGFVALVAAIAGALWAGAAYGMRGAISAERWIWLHRAREDAKYALAFCGIVAAGAALLFALVWAIIEK